jgi:hypothetical protein
MHAAAFSMMAAKIAVAKEPKREPLAKYPVS